MPPKKQRTNLLSGGLLANAVDARIAGRSIDNEEDDPLFGNAKFSTQKVEDAMAITDISAYPRIAIEKLESNPYQPRRRMSQKRLEKLANEIREHGFKGVLLARAHPEDSEKYQLVYGHRRREAAKLAGIKEIPVMIDNAITDDEMRFLAINENALRDDLTPIDEAYTFASMLEAMTQEAIAARLGVSRGYIRNRLDILKAPEDVQDMVEEKPDTMKSVVYLKDIEEDDIRKAVIHALMDEEITINQIKAYIENLRKARDLSEAKEELIIEQSKAQTEAVTDKTKIETYTKYLHKYRDRLHNREITAGERASLEALGEVIKEILGAYA